MCFSPEASFASAAVLVPVGVISTRVVLRAAPRLWPLAVVPAFFGVQQACEGVVWLGLDRNDESLIRPAAAAYLFFALAFWPTWFSLGAAVCEPAGPRRRFLIAWTVLSTGWFWLTYLPGLLEPGNMDARVVCHSIRYDYAEAGWMSEFGRWARRVAYVATATIPSVIGSVRRVMLPTVVLANSAAVATVIFYEHAFTSVWCLFAAVVSVSITYSIHTAGRVTSPNR